MRRLWCSLAVLAVLFTATLYSTREMHRFTDELILLLNQAQGCAAQGDWDAASDKTEAALIHWYDRETYLHLVLQHRDTDEILLDFQEVRQLIAGEEKGGEYPAANARLIARIGLLYEMEQLNLKNIL